MDNQFQRYFKYLILSCFLAVVGLVLITIWVDIFGIFGWNKDTRVYGEERISKYLMSFRYIPENFDGIILGPSLSANLDGAPLNDVRYFNASLMGARIQTLIPLLEQVLASDHNIRKAWVCLHPYMTQSDELGTYKLMTPESFWSSFGSIHLLRVYGFALIRWSNLAPNKYPQNQYLENGTNQFETLFRVPEVAAKIEEERELLKQEDFIISPVAKSSLKRLWQLLKAHQIQATIYFHPVPFPIYVAHQEKFRSYWGSIKATYPEAGALITFKNFNQTNFSYFTSDTSNYIDHGHLSKKGQHLLLKEINRE